ncbi:MAG: DUF6090 family protein [Melioribacteraceae bacterium]|nr:DUF6090 family protein [Melioribacteraceae bacterium]
MKKIIKTLRSKWVEYLLEIIVITIGILGAFALNNWHQSRQLRADELESLRNLRIEFQENYQQFDQILNFHKSKLATIHTILFTDLSIFSLSSLDSLNRDVIFCSTYNPSFSIYNSLIYSGNVNLIKNELVKSKIAKFKDQVVDYQDDEMHALRYSMDVIFPSLISDERNLMETRLGFKERSTREESLSKKYYLETFNDPVFRNQLVFLILYMEIVIDEGDPLKEEIISLIEMLDSEIQRLEG